MKNRCTRNCTRIWVKEKTRKGRSGSFLLWRYFHMNGRNSRWVKPYRE